MTKTYAIEGMHCGSCAAKITEALQTISVQASVTLNPPRAIISGIDIPNLTKLNEAVSRAGNYSLKVHDADASYVTALSEEKSWLATYYPLLLIIVFISVVSLKGTQSIDDWMLHFMAGFFIVFGFFKLLDLNGFKDAYATYDLLAKKWGGYGYIYPFLEIGLGMAFLFQFELRPTLIFSIVLMAFSSLGVIKALMEKRKIRCACLGTVLNLPMSTITVIEDLGMAVMSVFMFARIS